MSSNKEIRENIKNILLQKQLEHQVIAEQNLSTLMLNKDFKKAYYENKELEFEIAKKEFSGKDVSALKQKHKNNVKIISKVLKDSGLTLNDITAPKENITTQNVIRHKNYKELYNQQLLKSAGINLKNLASFDKADFGVFDIEVRESIKTLYAKMKEYSNDLYNSNKKTITISGKTGVGKTYLAECITTNAISKGVYSYFTTSIALGSDLLKFHLANVSEKQSILNRYLNPQLLVIDDLGVEPTYNNVTEEYMYLIIQDRLSKNKNTIITTNLTLEQIREVYGERIFSRIASKQTGLLINFTGKDLRLDI